MKKIGTLLLCLCLLSACSLPGLGGSAKDNNIVVAGGNSTERQILAEIVAQMIGHYIEDSKPSVVNNLGSTLLIVQTMERKDTNVSGAMYTGTSLTGELGLPITTDPVLAYQQVVKGYYDKYKMIWFPSYGFTNTYAFMVKRDFAEANQLRTVSDLKKVADQVRVGVDTAWMSREGDGYLPFQELYGFSFKTMYPMEIGLVYNALQADEMEVALGYSTDGRINAYDLVLLEDDLHLFPPYDASPVLTQEILETYPELETVLLKLEGSITAEAMQELNRLSAEERLEANVVAQQFLEANHYFEEKSVVKLSERPLYQDIMKGVKGDE